MGDYKTNHTIHWQPADSAPALFPGGLHLWRIQADARGDDLDVALGLLGERQQQRAQGMGHAAYRERYIRAQAGLRRVLGLYLGCAPQAVIYKHGPAGKPAIDQADDGGLEFNLTTTADLALVAISRGAEVGIDCEWIRPRRDLEAVARRMFAPDQVTELLTTPQPKRLAYFYRAWTALEADAKADGRGLFRPRPPGACPPRVSHCCPAPGHVAAVARAQLPPLDQWFTLEMAPRRSATRPGSD
ncbi:MAG TPA: 4'-phosphopantetheinyl transferase superfamily protein [Lamprocystis sp. (in: g-proteobacteria)]|nr:4'-phosphopantetheinyl transferase superfamily protein [Lamprocystis sp. (in: g-proteobacteria)]